MLSTRSASDAADAPQVDHLSFFVHDVALLTAERTVPVTLTTDPWQNGRVALIDMVETAAGANTSIRATLPAVHADYTGVRFVLGVPFEMNHADPLAAAPPLNRSEMFWTWQSGYKFLRADLRDPARSWSFHLGSTGCTSASAIRPPQSACTQPNKVVVELTGFDPTRQAIQVRIDALAAAMRAANYVACTGGYADNAACAPGYAITGLNVRTGECAETACTAQRLFSVQ